MNGGAAGLPVSTCNAASAYRCLLSVRLSTFLKGRRHPNNCQIHFCHKSFHPRSRIILRRHIVTGHSGEACGQPLAASVPAGRASRWQGQCAVRALVHALLPPSDVPDALSSLGDRTARAGKVISVQQSLVNSPCRVQSSGQAA